MFEIKSLRKKLGKKLGNSFDAENDSRFDLNEISFQVTAGHALGVIGPSGSGKSTLLRLILGLEVPDDGQIQLNGRIFSEGSEILVPTEKRNIGMVFQESLLFPHLDVFGNISLGLQSLGPVDQNQRVHKWVQILGIEKLLGRKVTFLSGGEQQRVALARALVTEPKLMLFDEAFSSLDCLIRREILDQIGPILREAKSPSVVVTHDIRDAIRFSSELLVLREGRAIQLGSVRSVTENPMDPWTRKFIESSLN